MNSKGVGGVAEVWVGRVVGVQQGCPRLPGWGGSSVLLCAVTSCGGGCVAQMGASLAHVKGSETDGPESRKQKSLRIFPGVIEGMP